MSFKGRINSVRRTIMHSLTRGVGSDKTITEKINVKRALICRPNSRLGNQLMITPVVQELTEMYPDCRIDLFVRGGLSAILFEKYDNIDRIIKLPKKPFRRLLKYAKVWIYLRKHKYDLAINVDGHSSSGRLATKWVKARLKLFGDVNPQLLSRHADYVHMAKQPVYNVRNLLFTDRTDMPVPELSMRLSPDELENGKKVLHSIVDCNKPTIGIYTFATGQKCFSKTLWAQMYSRIALEFGEQYNILEILPIENVSQIDFAAPAYYSKDIREIASLMANIRLFFGADSGMMHLASASPTPTIGLFSITSIDTYKPYNKGSVAVMPEQMSMDKIMQTIASVL